MKNLDDVDLVKKACNGDRDAFDILLERHYDTMYRMAFKFCGVQSDAQDITQNACIKLVRSLPQYKGKSAFTSWLYPLVVNTARDFYRAQSRHNHSDAGLDTAPAQNANAYDHLYAQQVMEHIEKLPHKEKEALVLVIFEGLSHGDAAKKLKCAESTISWRIHEARKKLESGLGQSHG